VAAALHKVVQGLHFTQQLPVKPSHSVHMPLNLYSALTTAVLLLHFCRTLSYFMHLGHLLPLTALNFTTLLCKLTVISAICTIIESLPCSWLDDNITVPATAAALSAAILPGIWPNSTTAAAATFTSASHAAFAAVSAASSALLGMQPGLVAGAAANSAVFAAGLPVLRKGLSAEGIAHAWLLGAVVFGVFGAGSYALMCLYFITGTLVSER
jgi:hypothetical protein